MTGAAAAAAGWLRGVVAHRGAPRMSPGNTLPGIGAAARLGAAAVEVDVRLTRDGTPVLHHDPRLPRRLGGTPVADLALDGLRARAGHVPTLAEALATVRPTGVPLVLDVGTIETARACLEQVGVEGTRAWFCGAAGALAWLRAEDAHVPLLLSWEGRGEPPSGLVADVAPTMFNPNHRRLSPRVVDRWHGRGVGVCTWTVDRRCRRLRLWRWGVDAIISNDVARALQDPALRGGPARRKDGA